MAKKVVRMRGVKALTDTNQVTEQGDLERDGTSKERSTETRRQKVSLLVFLHNGRIFKFCRNLFQQNKYIFLSNSSVNFGYIEKNYFLHFTVQ